MKFLLFRIALLLAMLCSTASASMFSDFVRKPVKWVEKQSGLKPASDHAHETMDTVSGAAKVVTDMGPRATLAVESITRTSDVARDLMISIKWPLVLAAYCGALWLASLALTSWRGRGGPPGAEVAAAPFVAATAVPAPTSIGDLRFSGRFVLIFLGALFLFAAVFATQLWFDGRLNLDAHLMPYLAAAGFRSMIAATLLCWIPIRRARTGFALGMAASVAMFAAIALGPEEPASQNTATTATATQG
jgi:hypothetical protein